MSNLACTDDFQPDFWPTEWRYEPQSKLGAMDAPDVIVTGAFCRHELDGGMFVACPTVMSRES